MKKNQSASEKKCNVEGCNNIGDELDEYFIQFIGSEKIHLNLKVCDIHRAYIKNLGIDGMSHMKVRFSYSGDKKWKTQ